MTLLVVAAAVFLSLLVGRRSVEDAIAVGFPAAGDTPGRLRIGLVAGLATFSLIVGPWVALVPSGA